YGAKIVRRRPPWRITPVEKTLPGVANKANSRFFTDCYYGRAGTRKARALAWLRAQAARFSGDLAGGFGHPLPIGVNSPGAAGMQGSRVDPRRSSYAQARAGRGDQGPAAPDVAAPGAWRIPTPVPGRGCARELAPGARSGAVPAPGGAEWEG